MARRLKNVILARENEELAMSADRPAPDNRIAAARARYGDLADRIPAVP